MGLLDGQLTTAKSTLTVVVIAVVLFVLGVGLGAYGVSEYQAQQSALDDAVEVEATVIESEVYLARDSGPSDDQYDSTDSSDVVYRHQVTFEYEYEGQQYTSSAINIDGKRWVDHDSESDAEQRQAEYAVGTQVTAHVVPDEPGEAFLEDDLPLIFYIIPAFGAFLVVGSVWMVGYHLYTQRRDSG